LVVLGITAVLQPISGDHSAKVVARTQPAKLAALEGQFATERCAPLRIGGLPDPEAGVTRYAVEIPCGLSFLAHGDLQAEVKGLNDFPPDQRPNAAIVHLAFQVMIGSGLALLVVGLWAALLAWRKRGLPDNRWLLRALVAAGPLGFVAIEAGWIVTEVGRQPWIVYGLVRTAEAVTPMPGLVVPLVTFTLLYIFLAVVVVVLLWRQVVNSPRSAGGLRGAQEAGDAVG
jgi:cytochrome d ubiquinol oxidase subunit I